MILCQTCKLSLYGFLVNEIFDSLIEKERRPENDKRYVQSINRYIFLVSNFVMLQSDECHVINKTSGLPARNLLKT